jgi:hypothetical protein
MYLNITKSSGRKPLNKLSTLHSFALKHCSEFCVVKRLYTNLNDLQSKHIVTDLINALPGNSSVNMALHAAIEEAVFFVSVVTSRSFGWWSHDVFFCDACPFHGCISDRIRSDPGRVSSR